LGISIAHSFAERGYGKVDKQRIPLTDNEIIEEHLGKYGYADANNLHVLGND